MKYNSTTSLYLFSHLKDLLRLTLSADTFDQWGGSEQRSFVKAIVATFQNGKTEVVPISDHCTRLFIPNTDIHHLHVWSPASIYPAPLHNLPIKRKLLSVTQKQEQEFWIINKTALRNLYTVENNNNSEHKFLPEFNWPKMYSVKAVLKWPKIKSCTWVP